MTRPPNDTHIDTSALEIVSTRDFDAPRDRVFAAFSDPSQVARWWGPKGFSNTIKRFDLKPGGAWKLVMHGPDGTDYHNESVFLEVVAPQRVVFQHLEPIHRFQMTMDFSEHGGRTRLVWRMRFESSEEFAKVSGFIAEANQQNFDRLSDHLASLVAVADTTTSDREIIISRVFDAPRELLWKAWTDPAHTSNWWGPAGFRTTTHRHDLRPGGVWKYTMHGPDGRDYENLMSYQEVVAPERLAYTMGGALDQEPVNFNVVVTFEKAGDRGERTRVTMRSVFASRDARDFIIREVNAVEGGKQHLARLGEYLGAMSKAESIISSPPDTPFVITRVFKAPRDLVFKVWTERNHLIQWFGPKGTTTPTCTLDLRVGGTFHYCMRMADGQEHWGKWLFREITAPQGSREGRLVFVASFADAQGNTVRQPWDKNWPMEWLSTVTFAEHAGIGRGTVVTVEWIPINASDLERATFDAGRPSMQQGWGGTMDRLTEHLAKTGTSSAPR